MIWPCGPQAHLCLGFFLVKVAIRQLHHVEEALGKEQRERRDPERVLKGPW